MDTATSLIERPQPGSCLQNEVRAIAAVAAPSEVDLNCQATLRRSFLVTPNGLAVDGTPSREDWLEVGSLLVGLSSSVHWLIGDWLNYGMEHYALTYESAQGLLRGRGFAFGDQTLRIDKYVASRIPLMWRHNKLTWQHHKEVAALDPEQREYWLCLAENRGLSTKGLRAAVSGAKGFTWLCYSDIWNFKESDLRFGMEHPGRIPGQVIQNLLHYYTEPGAFVVAPTDRYGTVKDVCDKCHDLSRDYLSFDIAPERADVMKADPTLPWPNSRQADLVFLAPLEITFPSLGSGEDLMTTMLNIISNALGNLKENGILSILVGSQLLGSTNRDWTWEIYGALRRIKALKYLRRLVVPETNHRTDAKAKPSEAKADLACQIRDMLVFEKQSAVTADAIEAPSRCFACGIRIGTGFSETRHYYAGSKPLCSDCHTLVLRQGFLRVDGNTFLTNDGTIMKKRAISQC